MNIWVGVYVQYIYTHERSTNMWHTNPIYSHLMSFTTSWWDMEDTSEPLTWKWRRQMVEVCEESSGFMFGERKQEEPLWFGPLRGPRPWLLHHLQAQTYAHATYFSFPYFAWALYHMFCWFQIGKHVHGGFSEHIKVSAGVSPSRTCCTSLTLSPQTVKPKPSWSFCTTTHRWTRPGPGERSSREVTNNRQTLMGRKVDPESQLPVLSTEMSGVSSLCCAAEDLRSESPMVRLLSLCLGDIRERLSTRRLIQKTLWKCW